MKKDPVRFSQRLLSGMLSFLLATQPLLPAMAAVITPEGNTQMDKAANGVPVVNIATPNQFGISHNKYNDYNVGKEGLILNNATGQFTQTQLGGIIQNNPNLQPGKEASGIINEVTGANRSQLQGYTEVAGKVANVMVANPYGITCNGCGFINTPNATLTTGKPVLDANGNLQSLDVSKGSITIEGKGLDGSQSDAVSIIARATEINAALHAKDLTVIAGANRVAANGQTSPLNGEGEAPKIAVDTGALGGMYANRIHLVSSEKGLGVNLGNLNARQGDITLNANGKLTIGNSLANGGLSARGEGVTLTGSHKTASGMTINSTGALALQDANLSSGANVQLGSDGKVTIDGGGIAAAGELQVAAKQDVAVAATTLVSQKNTSLRSDGSLTVTDGNLTSKEKLDVEGTHGLTLTRSTLGSDADVSLNSNGDLSAKGGLLSAGNGLTLKAQRIALDNASRADAKGALSLTGSEMNNQGQVNAGDALSLSGDLLVNGGQLAAIGSLDTSVSSLSNTGLMQGNSVSVRSGSLDNMGTLASGSQLSVQTASLNQQGILSAKNDADIRADVTLRNSGKLLSDGTLTVQAASVEQYGVLSGNQGVTLNAENLTAAKDSLIAGQQDIRLNVTQNLNLNGQVNAAGALNVGAKQLTTGKDGHLQSGLDLAITGNSVMLDGVQAAKGSLDVTADRLSHGGKSTGARVGFSAQQSVDNHGELLADTLTLSAATLTHSGSASAERISIIAPELLTSSGSLIADTLTLHSQHVVNSGLMQGNAAMDLQIDKLDNLSGGSLYARHSLALDIPYLTNHGLITTDGSLHLNGRQLVNGGEINGVNLQSEYATVKNEAAGRLLADTSLSVNGQQTDNLGLMAADTLALNSQDVKNDGNVLSVGELSLKSQTLHNTGLLQGGTLNLEANTWQNSGNALGETGVTATVHDAFTNQGKVLSQQGMTVHAASANNSGMLAAKVLALHGDLSNSGILQGNQALAWDGNRFTNLAGGQVTSGEDLQLSGKRFENDGQLEGRTAAIRLDNLHNSGSVQALDSLKIKANGRLDNQGSLRSLNLFELAAAQLFNDKTIAAKSLSISAPELMNNGIVQGNSALQLTTRNLFNGQQGQLVSGAGLDLGLDSLENHGLLLTNTNFTLRSNTLINAGDIQADSLDLTLANSVENQGNLVAKQGASINTASLDNRGTLAAKSVTLDGKSIRNSGLVQGNDSTSVSTNNFTTDATGKWLAGNALLVHTGAMENAGVLQGNTLTFTADSLNNSGVLNGLHGLEGKLSGRLTSPGHIQSGGALALTADDINSAGRIAGDRLTLAASTLNNSGLWQGTNGLALSGDVLTTGTTSRTLSGGALTFDAGNITTQGTLQGQQLTLTADNWLHKGSLISLGNLTATVNNGLTTSGDVMSHGGMSLTAQQLDNSGKLLSESDVTLDGAQFDNSGTVQGNTLTLQQNRIHNQGTLTGLQSLTLEARQRLMARMAMASPQQELINAAGGSLLTQGALKLTSGDVTNNGTWQGQSVLLSAQTLTNNGAIQSADALQLTLANNLTSAAGSKITALGNATLQALSLTNSGQWTAKNLTLKGTTLDNSAAISGVNALTLAMDGAVRQQKAGSMLSGGVLDLTAASVTNEGKIQGATLGMTTGALTNSGRLQGDNGATLSLSGDLINQASGEIVSRQGLSLSTPVLSNYGLMQGGGETHLNATTRALNDGKLLSGAGLTLTTAQYSGAGWLQATNLILNATTATNDGNWLADSATLAGTRFTNQGTAQAGQLSVKYAQLTNNGTLLGNSQLSVNASEVNQNAAGKLFSGGDLSVESRGLGALGQVVALGNLTLKLVNGFTAQSAFAAGKTLTITSDGAIDNRSVLQGQSLNLAAGGQLSNNGQITTGNGVSYLSGSNVALNAAGTLQGGGDITLTSRGNISVDGFTGTRGSLTLNAPGAIVNTALLYAANNLALYANTITNQRGDILAGNNLWMQRDAAGNANSEVVNTSGNIETQNGDITIKTGHLLNQRDGLKTNQTQIAGSNSIPGIGDATIKVDISELPSGSYGVNGYSYTTESGACNAHGACSYHHYYQYYYAPFKDTATQKFISSQVKTEVSSSGGAARISSGRNLSIGANTLDNAASTILANNNIDLSGSTLNNQSWQSGTLTDYLVYTYTPEKYSRQKFAVNNIDVLPPRYNEGRNSKGETIVLPKERTITFTLEGHDRVQEGGETYRSVIQAGGNVNARFTTSIGNENATSGGGRVSNTIVTPTLNTLSNQTISNGVQKQALAGNDTVSVSSPQWNDRLHDALQQINGGGSLESGGVSDSTLNPVSTTQKGNASLGQLNGLINPGEKGVNAAGQNQGKTVDTSAYPLPSGNNGYFVVSDDPKSPYLINVNPKLNGLGQLDPSLFGDLNAMLGIKPGEAPRETNIAYTDQNQFLGSAYMLDRLKLNPEYDYRFLGDAAFDTRYVSNAMLNQTGSRYINGIGSDLDQMRYLMDSAVSTQQSLGLKFGVALTADQIASLEHSMLWWEAATVNGETVMIPKLYLSPKDITVNNGSVIAGNNVQLTSGNITNSGSTLLARNDLTLDSQNSINNLNNSLMQAGGNLDLSARGDINNVSSAISGKTVALESLGGNINNLTLAEQIDVSARDKYRNVSFKDTLLGSTASITAQDGLSLSAGKDITVTGANLSAGGSLLMEAWGDIAVNANQINDARSHSGRWITETSRSSVDWQGSTISAGGNLGINAGNNLNVTASDVNAGGNAQLTAGNDLNLNAATTQQSSRNGGSESHSTGLSRTTVSAGDNLVLKAGQDINSHATGLAAENDVGLLAGRDVNLLADATTDGDSYRAKKKTVVNDAVRQQGTEIASGGDAVIIAGRDVNAQAADVTAQGDIGVTAGRDVNLTTATESDYHYQETTKTKKGFLSKKTTHTIEEDSATREKGALLSGNNVTVAAGNNILVQGSAVAGDGNVALGAGNNVDIVAATNTDTSWRFKETKKSGLMGSGGIGFTIGSSKTTHDLREQGTTQSESFSTVGSTGGNVSITAGQQAHIGGADIIAQKDIAVRGDSVLIEPGHDKRTRDEKFEQKTSGLTVALSGAAGSAVNSAVSAAQGAKQSSDSRLAALQGTQAVLSGVQAGQAVALDQAKGTAKDNTNTIGISASLGSQSSKSTSHSEQDSTTGSTLNAGNSVNITSTGSDITIAGSEVKAGKDVALDAARDVNLIASQDTQLTTGKNSSSGGSIGVGIGVGSGGAGISVSANANSSKGHEKGNGTWQNETTVDAGNQVTIHSGRDTTLAGAQVNGKQVTADVGRDLTITSTQDSDHYDSKQNSVSGGVGYTFGAGTASASLNASRDRMKSDFDSVQEQSGIFAGDGGFDITVGKHTQLDGAVIASTGSADKNSLDTGTLGFGDIHNQADYKVEHQGGGISTGGSIGQQFAGNLANALIAGGGSSGHAEGTTQAAVSEGTITVRDTENQKQDVAGLSRDAEHANGSISPIFDKEKEQKRLQEVQLIGQIGNQAADIARTQGEINGLNAGKKALAKEGIPEPDVNASDEEKARYQTQLRNSAAYKTEQAKYGTGSDIQRGIQAAVGALQGLAGGDIGAALAGASAPELANIIGHKVGLDEDDIAAKAIAHAILGGAAAAMQGNNAAAGAAGAAAGELAANAILKTMYPGKHVSELDESDRQLVSNLATIASGLAGNLAGGDSKSTTTGAQSGKNAVENNYLSSKQLDAWSAEMKSCQAKGGDCGGIIKKYEELSTAQQKQLISDCAASPATCQQKYGDVLTDSLAVKQAIDRALGEDIPIKMVYDLTATFAQQMQAEGVVATNKVSEALQKEYGLDEVQAGIVASAAASAFGGISKAKGNSQPKIEQILKPEKNWETARNKALDLVGNLGADSKPVIGRLEVSAGNGKVIGRQSSDGKVGWRVDYDPEKGTHINIWDYSQGKGPGKAVKQVIPFEGNEKSFETILKQLNR
ncbi:MULTISPECIES: hemagglutinin repeat-containing protein [Citrobacter]|uniref:hemagglutinin repeat-containing protein n=1 Tax=Citrobacter TaxID=544 RepID=UPI00155F73A8|nr:MULTISPECIES: hemagglutinin repeat-containing protein [Citrobacter]NRF58048.1 hemagglutinin repeat-containing protein [Citrobacter braakii]MCB6777011.1 hemagglutinin repeat-containing protein [Citrobacter sp. 210820-DFI.7.8]MCB6786711.1 hemagglutinin repeat-containing protein [Citrobacter sp. 210820-DFI.7.7]MCB8602000.1 hemagglutinin repeat-containing protein [Citrobacter europaeus]MCQ5004595.1 hemagglutinin repeat-containing protein [Citrobacter europaeus]